MNDPRDEGIDPNDELTESSTDELIDLQKEYELKLQQILQKKELKRQQKEQKISDKQVINSPEKDNQKQIKQVKNGEKPVAKPFNPFKSSEKVKPSSFIEKLYGANIKKSDSINFDNRIFEFSNIPKPVDIEVDEMETYSKEHLRKRYLTKEDLSSLIKDIKILKIDKLLAKVAPPLYNEPNYENWGFIGFILNKSEPKLTKDNKKFLKLSVGSFNHSVDLMLFGGAFNRYWKLKVGDLVILLNPQINKFKPPFKGFNLKMDEDLDAIIEIGSIKNFGYCSAIKQDNKQCQTVINVKQDSLCSYHLDMKFKKSQNKRMELNGSVHLKSPTKKGIKQSMYLNKNGTEGYLNYDKINENTKVYCIQPNKINRSEYHDPKLLDNLSQKRRKLNDEKSNKLLEKKLAQLSNNQTIKSLGLIKQKSSPSVLAQPKVFNSQTLNKIGFNPISTSTVYKSPSKKRNELSDDLKELYDLSSKSSKKLSTSSEDILSKKKKWLANLRNLQQHQKNYQHDNIRDPTVHQSHEINLHNRNNSSISDPDTDSDIDIMFDSEHIEREYTKRVNRHM